MSLKRGRGGPLFFVVLASCLVGTVPSTLSSYQCQIQQLWGLDNEAKVVTKVVSDNK